MIVVESVLPDLLLQSELGAGPTVALRTDLIMLALASVGARERTLQEFQELAKSSVSTSFQCWNSTKHNMLGMLSFTSLVFICKSLSEALIARL